jgi:sucrose phosphorylase
MKAKVTDIRDLPAVQPQNELIERIQRRIEYLYGAKAVPRIMQRLTQLLHEHLQKRPRPVSEKYWTQEDIALITYGDAVRSVDTMPLQTLHSFLNKYLMEEFSMVHLLSIFPWSSDDGFSVTDFRAIDPQLGSWNDVVAFDNEYDLIFDLILNHCSRKNQWFTDYIEGTEPACNYFIEVDPKTDLSKVTRPRTSPLLSEVGTHKGLRHVWTTFSSDQVDMNFSNPDVLLEFIDILLHYYRREARVVRLDAVAYLWKQVGTNCIHLRQTHEIVKLLRDVLDIVEPEALIMTETTVPHAENISYFGDGDEAHLIYQFSLPPLLLHALYAGNTRYLKQWALELEASEPPPGCTYFNFTASHDGVGLRPLEGLVPLVQVDAMVNEMCRRGGYVSRRMTPDGVESPYELNISYFDAFRHPDPAENQWHINAFMVSQTVALSLKGIPAVYMHSLTATPNDHNGVRLTGVNRSINRRRWDREKLEALIENSYCETSRVFWEYKRVLGIRRRQKAFHPAASQHVLDLGEGMFGIERMAPDGSQRIIALYNFTPSIQVVTCTHLPRDMETWTELIGRADIDCKGDSVSLSPYASCWFSKMT